jgi:hypothetical protein
VHHDIYNRQQIKVKVRKKLRGGKGELHLLANETLQQGNVGGHGLTGDVWVTRNQRRKNLSSDLAFLKRPKTSSLFASPFRKVPTI